MTGKDTGLLPLGSGTVLPGMKTRKPQRLQSSVLDTGMMPSYRAKRFSHGFLPHTPIQSVHRTSNLVAYPTIPLSLPTHTLPGYPNWYCLSSFLPSLPQSMQTHVPSAFIPRVILQFLHRKFSVSSRQRLSFRMWLLPSSPTPREPTQNIRRIQPSYIPHRL